jgi:hypothetical protein
VNRTLAKAALTAYEPPKEPGKPPGSRIGEPLKFQFNPNTLVLTKGVTWRWAAAKGAKEVGVPEFGGTQPREMSVELFLDATGTHDTTVQDTVDKLLSWCVPTESSRAQNPTAPWVRFTWGAFFTVSFFSCVQSVQATYSLFDPNGRPLRATCSVSLKEVDGPLLGQNPTSGAVRARRVHRVVIGDSLESLANAE